MTVDNFEARNQSPEILNPEAIEEPSEGSRFQKFKEIFGAAKEDFGNTSLKGKVILGSLMGMGAYEWGPGNETVTPIITGQALDVAAGAGGIAVTAAVAGGFTAGQQLAAGYLARRTAQDYPGVSDKVYENINEGGESEEVRFKPFRELPFFKKFLYSTTLGSSFNILREASVTGDTNEADLKKVSRASAMISGGTVAAIGGGVDLLNQHFDDSETVQFVIDKGVKNPALWLGLMGVVLATDYFKNRSKTEPNDPEGLAGYGRNEADIERLLVETIEDQSSVFIDETTNPDMGNFAIYKLDSTDERADIGRTLEADIFGQGAGYSKEFIQENFEPYDGNSFFFVLVDKENTSDPKVAGVLRVIDCVEGSSETVSMFKEFHGEDTKLPEQLDVEDGLEAVWDVMTVAVKPEYRNGLNSAWLYHALYRSSLSEGVNKWISNVTPKEMRNLRDYSGIPFTEIEGAPAVFDEAEGAEGEEYGFYSIEVDSIEAAVQKRIEEIEKQFGKEASIIARIALNGKLVLR